MNVEMGDAIVRQHMNIVQRHVNELRDQVHRGRSDARAPQARAGRSTSGLRHRLGLTLVEAGLHLLATDGPVRPATAPRRS